MQQIDTLPPYNAHFEIATDTADSSIVVAAPNIYDSIFTPIVPQPTHVRKSIFTHSQLEVKHNHEIAIQHAGTSGWFFGFIALSILLICLFFRHKQISMTNLLQSAIDHRAMDRMLRDTNLTHSQDLVPIALIMLIPMTLVGFYNFFAHGNNIWLDILHYLSLLLSSYLIYFARNGIFRFFGNAFNNQESIHLYISSNYIYHLLYAIAATALSFFIFYTDTMGETFFYILAGLIGVLFIIRLIRGLQLILTFSKTPKFYLFYYLCILEIVPIIIIITTVIS